ncbi:hypothetical protein DFH09DRAFT_1361754 [Mycena vulgaris]|nr:hypothetical protein DFH09DRAFT_1361754 [Mycena vulgaris]
MDTPAELVRSAEFWFDDGTVVLQVENTLYRVYRGLLSSRSTVFYDTFSIPQPTEDGNEIEGCPVIQLHDSAKDFTRFLKALHQYGAYPLPCPVAGMNELVSVLRLSDKYDVPVLRDSMLSIMSLIYPSTFDKWPTRTTPPGYRALTSDDLVALAIAVKMEIRSVLPVVMYDLCCSTELASGNASTRRIKIGDAEYRDKCIAAIPRLMAAQKAGLGYLTRDEDNNCGSPAECDAERLRWLALELEDPVLDPLAEEAEESWLSFALCPPCLGAAKVAHIDARRKLWDALPDIFGLGTWEELLT